MTPGCAAIAGPRNRDRGGRQALSDDGSGCPLATGGVAVTTAGFFTAGVVLVARAHFHRPKPSPVDPFSAFPPIRRSRR
ncbi:MAG: hypothetical protein EOP32_19175 [Rhodococcus sp. (in: high G+C Gram-positive bacteria)]|nr:MAG: hypothetical protein EOP32_19175 [Rhodococcus sp. (in: high G+C Gram-positive bacteria)]